MKIQVCINEEGALRNQRYAFTDRFTLVSELLQNARRAGARRVVVDYDAAGRRLTVRDDGRGIDDFQKLLSLHESGWREDTVGLERPFGVGFSKCLYAAERCIVASGARRVDIDTAAALRRERFEVQDTTAPIDGTCIDLHGVDLPDLARRMDTLCEGFPIDVVFNGQPLQRRYAEDQLTFMSTPIGAVHLAGGYDGRCTRDTLVFLQGFCVQAPSYLQRTRVNVVHLDPREFLARLPDRDMLIDADQQLTRVSGQLKRSWRELLECAKAQLPEQQFVQTYYDAMRCWGHLNLLNDVDTLPAELFERIADYPIQVHAAKPDYLQTVQAAPSRSAIEHGEVRLVVLDPLGEENAALWMMARHCQWLIFRAHGLDAGHWVQRFVRDVDPVPVEVEPLDVQARVRMEGRWVYPEVVLCRAVRIRLGQEEAEIADAGVCHEGSILVPAGETSGEAVRQFSDFVDENEFALDDAMQADRELLAELIRHLRATDPAATLDALLAGLKLGRYPLLHGKTFEVTVGIGGAPGHSVVLAATRATETQPGGDRHARC